MSSSSSPSDELPGAERVSAVHDGIKGVESSCFAGSSPDSCTRVLLLAKLMSLEEEEGDSLWEWSKYSRF